MVRITNLLRICPMEYGLRNFVRSEWKNYDLKSYRLFAFTSYFLLLTSYIASAQHYNRIDNIPVKENGNPLKFPWAGGLNYVQVSAIDMNFDGKKDLFVFDRTSHKVHCFINGGTPNLVDYYDSTEKYAWRFPHMEDWALLRDYDKDGLPDIFTYAITVGGIKVWKNTSSGGNLQFTLEKTYLTSDYGASTSNLYVSRIDLPSIEDVDGDGDLDVVTIDFSLTQYEYHVNQSVEDGYGKDSLIFKLSAGCWGHFNEPFTGCGVNLGQSCRMRMDDSAHIHPFAPPLTREEEYAWAIAHDGGNCALCMDIDGDGDKDLLLGQKCCNMTMLTNGGSITSANMVAKDTLYPVYDISVALTALPCGFYVDVNNDNVRDLVVCPNMAGISIDKDGIWYYKNNGTDSAPVFARKKRNLLQEDMIDMGSGGKPVFFDFDNDGLTDILISTYNMKMDSTCNPPDNYNVIYAYKNIGTASAPAFNLVNTDYATLSTQLATNAVNAQLAFGDIDGDTAPDMFVGDDVGYIHYFKNTGGAGPANFILITQDYPDSAGVPINVGHAAAPQLIDVDRDGDLDLIIGERSGKIYYYRNIGTKTFPSFKLVTKNFGGIDVVKPCCTGYAIPFMYDSAGSYHLLVATEASRNTPAMGWIWHFDSIDGNLTGNFRLRDSMYQNIWEGERMTINGKDINNDGIMDLVIGNFAGGAAIYTGDTTALGTAEINPETFDFSIYPNPSNGMFNVQCIMANGNTSTINHQPLTIEIYNVMGEKVYAEKILNQKSLLLNLNLGQGIYFCKLTCGKTSKTKKLIVIK
ncbi:MAG: T9SS type A sorting domain-containing protein [Bacteroidetes bacterium]|nr:T9SS type A sorting domain-containing protein [Bacteroidota bacterium]